MEKEPAVVWTIVLVLGVALTVIGWTDLALLWYPFRLGNPEWEFGTISGFFDGLPLGTIGLTLITIGTMRRGLRRTSRALGVLFGVIALMLMATFAIYLLDVPLALRSAAPEMKVILKKAMLKTGVFFLAYVSFYGWLSWFLWRKTKLHKV